MSYDSNLDRLTVVDLRAIAADLKIAGRSKMKRAELVAAITRAEMDAKWNAAPDEETAKQDAPAPTPTIDDHAAAVAQLRANREAEEEERAAARRARNRTNYAPMIEADAAAVDAATAEHENEEIDLTSTIDDMISGWLPEEVTSSDHNPDTDGRPAAVDLPSEFIKVGTAAAQAARAIRKFAEVTTGEVVITRYTGCDAIATARFDSGSIGAWAAKVQGRWVLRDGDRTIRAKTLSKVAKLWAKQLGFYATTIVIDTMS